MTDIVARGALVGWKRVETESGTILTVQVASSSKDYRERRLDEIQLALNDRQLRSLARDLARAVQARGLDLEAPRRWWSFGRGLTES